MSGVPNAVYDFVGDRDPDRLRARVFTYYGLPPEDALHDLYSFFKECVRLEHHKLDHPEYLAARFLVYRAMEECRYSLHPLDFLSLGVQTGGDVGVDTGYRYVVKCGSHAPPQVEACLHRRDSKTGEWGFDLVNTKCVRHYNHQFRKMALPGFKWAKEPDRVSHSGSRWR